MTERETAKIGDSYSSGAPCSACGMGYAECTRRMFAARFEVCCKRCAYTDTHEEKKDVTPKPEELNDLQILEGIVRRAATSGMGGNPDKSLLRLANALEAEHKKNAILTVAGEPHRRSRRRWESLERNVESAQAKIDKVRELHQPWEESGKCRECSSSLFSIHSVRWPCATIRALGDEND